MIHDPSFWFLISFVIFCGAIGKKAWVSIKNALDQKAKHIEKDLHDAKQALEAAEALLQEQEILNEQTSEKAKEILRHAQLEATRLKKQAMADFDEFVKSQEHLLEERIRRAETQALHDLRETIIEASFEAAAIALKKQLTPAASEKLSDELLASLSSSKEFRKFLKNDI